MSTLGRARRGVPRLRVMSAVNWTGSRILNESSPDPIPAPLVDDLWLMDREEREEEEGGRKEKVTRK